MIDAIAPYATGPLASLEPVPLMMVPAALPAVGAADQGRFQSALQPIEAPNNPPFVPSPLSVPTDLPASPGDVILQGLERLRGNYREVSAEMTAVANQHTSVSPQELIGLQMQMAQVTLGTQLIGQVASKLEQNLNTLLKGS
jgi:type III secretion system YscI/HrpB-like protein